ncbi:DUF4260 domain-containing protein [Edaphobacter flagellatus]|uniref:DUF4260 domain-containing protein n=1 Tax=Edaphobacter flagellatus TaxID=1933044 RepID=UPI0021B424D0|nr:DUF4260 domain-containing protein [Edaphobacter flagellatus]
MLTRPSHLLKLEDALLFLAILFVYFHLHLSWLLFAILFLAPDLFMLGYLSGPRTGSAIYNLAHTYFLPILLAAIGFYRSTSLLLTIALIWASHIAFDRVLGYGLKYPTHFKDTHLQHLDSMRQ